MGRRSEYSHGKGFGKIPEVEESMPFPLYAVSTTFSVTPASDFNGFCRYLANTPIFNPQHFSNGSFAFVDN
jgi:hypothetical protein